MNWVLLFSKYDLCPVCFSVFNAEQTAAFWRRCDGEQTELEIAPRNSVCSLAYPKAPPDYSF